LKGNKRIAVKRGDRKNFIGQLLQMQNKTQEENRGFYH